MIPRTIHYCWFGGRQLPDDVRRFVDGWRRVCHGYEIKRWDETNFDIETCHYAAQAYSAGKYAFVSDVARLHALVSEGGIYLDTDVEVVRPFDQLLDDTAFAGYAGTAHIATSTLAAEPGHPFFKAMLDSYHGRDFIKPDGTPDTQTNVALITGMLSERGLKCDGRPTRVADITIYPFDRFSPYDYVDGRLRATSDTFAIHRYAQTWIGSSPMRRFISIFFHRLTGRKLR